LGNEGFGCQVSGVRCQRRRWVEKFTRLRRAASLIEKETIERRTTPWRGQFKKKRLNKANLPLEIVRINIRLG
jgi:hypothetical protein